MFVSPSQPTLATALLDGLRADDRAAALRWHAKDIRRGVTETIAWARMGHIGGDFSVADILTTLFFGALKLDPAEPRAAARDRFIFSKGHRPAALCATLAHHGILPVEQLPPFLQSPPALNGHPNRRKVPGIKANSGPLGHGQPNGGGSAVVADELAERGMRARVLNVSTIKPLDETVIVAATRETRAIVTVEEATIEGGLGAAVAEIVVRRAPIPMRLLGARGFAPTGSADYLFDHFDLNRQGIVAAALELKGQ